MWHAKLYDYADEHGWSDEQLSFVRSLIEDDVIAMMVAQVPKDITVQVADKVIPLDKWLAAKAGGTRD